MSEDVPALVERELRQLRDSLYARGFGKRLGFGAAPVLLVVDFIRAFTDVRSPLAADMTAEVEETRVLVDAAHRGGTPVIFTTIEYDDALEEAGVFGRKTERTNTLLIRGTEWVELDDRLGADARDRLLVKKYASCFFGTDLSSRLVSSGIDTVVIAGCTTSGCVRATAVDACSLGLRPIVVAEAVGDRAPISHLTSLFDIDFKYGDVVSGAEAAEYLARSG